MTDQFDRAQALELADWEARQRAVLRAAPAQASASHCAGCGASIPDARRAAVPGVQLCVDCQAEAEAPTLALRAALPPKGAALGLGRPGAKREALAHTERFHKPRGAA